MANEVIKTAARANKVFLWEIAEACGVTEGTFCRKLRHELPAEECSRLMTIIEELGKKKREAM